MKRELADHSFRMKSLAAAVGLLSGGVQAADFEVTNRNDSGEGSLRWAIDQAESTPGQDNITFASSVSGTINLQSALPTITEGLSITAPGITLNASAIESSEGPAVISIYGSTSDSFSLSGMTIQARTNNKCFDARLQLVGKEIIDLGEPPNAAGLMKKARQKHEDAFKEFSPKPLISIFPAKLKAVPGREYTFRIEIADYEKYRRKDKLHLTCEGREKIKDGVLIIKKTFHKKIGSTEKFTVQLHQYPGPEILASRA